MYFNIYIYIYILYASYETPFGENYILGDDDFNHQLKSDYNCVVAELLLFPVSQPLPFDLRNSGR